MDGYAQPPKGGEANVEKREVYSRCISFNSRVTYNVFSAYDKRDKRKVTAPGQG